MAFLLFLIFVLTIGPIGWAAEPESSTVDAGNVASRRLDLPATPYRYGRLELPERISKTLQELDNTPENNPITDHGATLGRVLFYDKTLSANGTTSCATCHIQKHAFAEPKATSVGFQGESVTRNSMSLVNLRFYRRGRFFWDERAPSLEAQVLMPIENPIEMGHDLKLLVKQLSADPLYPPLFENAFGDQRVSETRISKALAQFVRSIVSFESRYDVGLRQVDSPKDPFPNFTDQENLGKTQFFGRALCAECHLPSPTGATFAQSVIFQLDRPGNNGVDMDGADADVGVAAETGQQQDQGKFKPSSLRNIELTGPYMHDGRFITLDQVIEHYNWSIRPHPNLDPRLADLSANGLGLPEVPKVALAAFLATLTDHKLTTDPKYSDPFLRE